MSVNTDVRQLGRSVEVMSAEERKRERQQARWDHICAAWHLEPHTGGVVVLRFEVYQANL